MDSPETTQSTGEEAMAPNVIHCTPPEDAVQWECPDAERVVSLGSDSDSEGSASGLDGFRVENAAHFLIKRRLSGCFEDPSGFPSEKVRILEIKMCLESTSEYADLFRRKIQENFEKTVESLKNYRSDLLRETGIPERSSNCKLNISLSFHSSSPEIIDFETEDPDGDLDLDGETCAGEFQQAGKYSEKVDGVGISQMDGRWEEWNVANMGDFECREDEDLFFNGKGKAIAQIKGFQKCQNDRGANVIVPAEAVNIYRRCSTNGIAVVAANDVAAGAVEIANSAQKSRCHSNEDSNICDKEKVVTDCVETSMRSGEVPQLKVRGVTKSAVTNPENSKDSSQNKQVVSGNARPCNDGEKLGAEPPLIEIPRALSRQSDDTLKSSAANSIDHSVMNETSLDVFDILKRLAENSKDHGVSNECILDAAKKHGVTFPSQGRS